MILLILITVYSLGYWISFSMLRIEHAAENNTYTKGDSVLTKVLAILSWLMVLWMLINAWVEKIKATGYWNKPANEKRKAELVEIIDDKKNK